MPSRSVRTIRQPLIRVAIALGVAALALQITGCAIAPATSDAAATTAAVTTAAPNGRVMGGQQPVAGATIQLWAVQTNGAAAKALLSPAVTTNSNGNFTITSLYTCPSASTQVYLTATGGNSGFSSSNSGIALMAAIGACSSLTSSSFITINEVTTVASVWALQQFIGATYGVAGSEDIAVNTLSQSVTGMQNAFATVPVLASIASGTSVSTYANATIESTKINTIADILSTCINSTGTGLCADLYAAVTPSGSTAPADTIQAALYMAKNPLNNVAQIFNYVPAAGAPFQPTLTTAPYDWTLGVFYSPGGSTTAPVLPYYLTADASGNIWVVNEASSNKESLIELGPNGQPAAGSPFLVSSSSPTDAVSAIAVDTIGNIWMANNKASSSYNNLISFPGTGSTYTSYAAPSSPTFCSPDSMAIDGKNDIYFACSGITNLFEFPNTGTVTSPVYPASPTQFGAVGSTPNAVAVDQSGNVWVANEASSSISQFPAGFTTATTPTKWTLSGGPYAIAADNYGDIWAVSSSSLYQIADNSGSYVLLTTSGGGLNSAKGLAVDGSGNIWVANSGTTTIASTTYISVSEFNNYGNAITGELYQDLPGGYAKALPSTFGTPQMRGITIDPSGNVWVAGCALSTSCNSGTTPFIFELVGAATPVVTPLSSAIAANDIACCSFTPTAPGGTPPTSPGYITLAASTYSPLQLGGSLSFQVTRTGGSTGAVSVSYATSDGTARSTGGSPDYTATSGTLSWSSGNTAPQTITVPWNDTTNYSGTKTFTLTLSSPTGGAVISPNPSTTVTVGNQVTSSIVTAGTYPFFTSTANTPFNLTPPSNYFNTIPFYLQLPIDPYGGTGGVNGIQFTIQSVGALIGFSDPYFYLNSSNQIVFTAPANGAVTEAPSSAGAVRSELKEGYNGTGSDGGGNWYPTTGGSMTGSCILAQNSAGSDELTFAQIHGSGSAPFVILEYRPANNDVAIRISTTSANTAQTYTELATNVSLGDTITYSLSYSAPSSTASGTVTVQATDTTSNTTTGVQTITIDPSWSSVSQYFKVGAYQGGLNTNNLPSAYSQVIYNSWNICHLGSCVASHAQQGSGR